MLKIIGLTGLSCSGKSYLADKMEETEEVRVIRLGECLRKLKNYSNSSDIQKSASEYKYYSLGNYFLDDIEWCKEHNKILLIDSIRTLADYNFFNKLTNNFKLVMLVLDSNARLSRSIKRNRIDKAFNFDSLKQKDIWEMEFGIIDLISYADLFLLGDESSFENSVNQIKRQLEGKFILQ